MNTRGVDDRSKDLAFPLELTEELRKKLEELRASGSAHPRRIMRARILLLYAEGQSIAAIQKALDVRYMDR